MPIHSTHEVLLHDPRRGQWMHFTEPVAVVEARHLSEVVPALLELQRAVDSRGCHAAGFISYEAAPAFDPALTTHPADPHFPLLWFGLFAPPALLDRLPFPPAPRPLTLTWTPSISRTAYDAKLARLRDYLYRGDTYQVNFTQRLQTRFDGDPRTLFAQLVHAQGAHYSAYVHTGPYTLCSASPELFFRLEDGLIETRPMKGTVRRGRSTDEDNRLADLLRHSEKNRAENVMIVDMIRNDLGRVAIPGTVTPVSLFDIERYPTVWQMTSAVTCRTRAAVPDILSALFPCASITGAPKPRTMAIIAEVEETPRRIYTGGIGHISPGGHARFSVAIRTILLDHATAAAEYGVGGGIVWDSVSRDEYDECLLKAAVLLPAPPDFSLLETMLWTPSGGFFLLDRHLERLGGSARYFDVPLAMDGVNARLAAWAAAQSPLPSSAIGMRVRLLVAPDGGITLESAPLKATAGAPEPVALAPTPIHRDDRFLYHKTTRRAVYEAARAACPGAGDVLLWNEAGELTESTIANLVADIDGALVTPPVECGLLPGTFRAQQLAQGRIREGVIRVDDLPRCRKLYLVNSVRQWREARLIETPACPSRPGYGN